ncbi:MAG: DUF4435 domain-containing protein [Deltaproteobacteria bacterium]|nr:DUF4435 domain-containing protein [Deltaproteobacteria bacterium]
MKELIQGSGIANRIRMLRDAHRGSFLLVEGDDDARLFSQYVHDTCKIQPAYGRPNTLEAVVALEATSTAGVCAVIDADFSRHKGELTTSKNVFWCDHGDLECMLFLSPALDSVLAEHTPNEDPADIRQEVVRLSFVVAAVRAVSEVRQLGLKFSCLNFENFIDASTLTLSFRDLASELQQASRCGVIDIPDLEAHAQLVMSWCNKDKISLCRGHDLVKALSLGLRRKWGSQSGGRITVETLERELRIGFSRLHCEKTELWSNLASWGTRNSPYRIV